MLRKNYFIFTIIIFFLVNSRVFAEASLYSFSASNSNTISGQIMSLSWTGYETNGYTLTPVCSDGVKLKQENGTLITCNMPISTSVQDNDNITFYTINISGSSKTVNFRLYPKSKSGQDLTALTQTQTVIVSPAVYPITSATLSASTTSSGKPITVTWTSTDLDGVNMVLDCVDSVSYTKQDGASIPCGSLGFSEKLNGNGSQDIYFKNNNSDKKNINIKILPYIGGGAYDSTHSVSLNLDVSSDKIQPYQIQSFTTTNTSISDSLNLNWTTINTSGVNIKFSCDDSVTFYTSSITPQKIKCNEYTNDSSYGPNSSVYFIVSNSSNSPKTIEASLIAQLPNGGYDATNPKKINLTILPLGYSRAIVTPTPTVLLIPTVPSQLNTSVSNIKKNISARKKFLKNLSLGSRGDDVSALQEFLSKNGYYPEGLVTGYMGPATVRAVKRFQEQNNIAKSGQAGYGNFGPATRGKVNSF